MALIRSKLHLAFPKSFIEPFSLQFSTVLESTQNPNFSEIDANISSNISPQEHPVVRGLHLLIKDHYKKNQELYKKNPKLLKCPSYNFTDSSLADSFSQVTPGECISPSVVVSVIEKCRYAPNGIPFPQALTFFNWAVGQRDNVEIFKQGFVEMVDLAVKAKRTDVALDLIKEIKRRKLDLPSEVLVRLIRRYIKADVSVARYGVNWMDKYGFSLDNAEIAAVIAMFDKKKLAVEAQSFFDSLKDRCEPDVVIYTNLLKGWFRVRNISKVERVFREMKRKGIVPNVYTYNTLIVGLCRLGQITRAHDVFSEMIEKGCQPNAVSFNSLMRFHVKMGRTEKVLEVYNQMKRLGCQPDVSTYNVLIDCHCRDGNRDDALKLIHEMVKKDILPNAHSFNPIFKCITQVGDVNAAHTLFAKMKELKCEPNTVTYNVLMRMFVESNSTDMVLKLKKEMDEFEVEPNVKTYKILISMFCAMGHWSNVCKYFKEMVEEQYWTPPRLMYEEVIMELRIAGQNEKAEELVDMMDA